MPAKGDSAGGGSAEPRSAKANRGPLVAILGGVGAFETEALTWMLTEGGSRVMGVYGSPRELREDLRVAPAEPQALFIDADDGVCGIAVLPEVRRAHAQLKILLLCEAVSATIVRGAIEQRVEGVVLKSDSVDEVIEALRHVLEGRSVMPAGWQAIALEPQAATPLELLSEREREVLELAAGGMRNREIAERLMISPNTVKFHLRSIYSHLGVRNRIQAARAARAVEPQTNGGAREDNRSTESNTSEDEK